MGAAQVIGIVLSAKYVAVQLDATMQLLTRRSAIFDDEILSVCGISPVKSKKTDNASHPENEVRNKTGNTELLRTLAFLERS
jgi:hypothetical protein